MKQKPHQSNRTQRRAAERAALKAARKAAPQFIAVQAPKTLAATASGLPTDPGDGNENQTIPTSNPAVSTESEPTYKSGGPQTPEGKQISAQLDPPRTLRRENPHPPQRVIG